MPEDLLLIYCKRICAILRRKINAKIYVNGNLNNSEINIEIDWLDFQYLCTIDRVYALVYRGISSEDIAEHVYRNYKEKLLGEAFI
jgi:hypothetical protein